MAHAWEAPLRPDDLRGWPRPFDPQAELDWGDPVLSRRLLREHLDQSSDSASRRLPTVERQVSRLAELLPAPPARLLDAACGPGLYAVPLARRGYDVVGIDVGPAPLRHARALARQAGVSRRCRFLRADLGARPPAALQAEAFDAVLLVYYVLEAFPRATQAAVLRRLGALLRPGGVVVAELRVDPGQPPGRLASWTLVPRSLLSDRRHLLLSDTTWDERRRLYVLREIAVLDDGLRVQQTTGALTSLVGARTLVRRAGLRLRAVHEGWTAEPATRQSDALLVVAERPG